MNTKIKSTELEWILKKMFKRHEGSVKKLNKKQKLTTQVSLERIFKESLSESYWNKGINIYIFIHFWQSFLEDPYQ